MANLKIYGASITKPCLHRFSLLPFFKCGLFYLVFASFNSASGGPTLFPLYLQ